MEIDIFDYVEESEIREIIIDGLKRRMLDLSEHDFTRIMNNALHNRILEIAGEVVREEGYEFDIRNQIKKKIKEITVHNIFGYNTHGQDDDTVRNRILMNKIVEEEKELLRESIKSNLKAAYDEYNSQNEIADMMSDFIYELFSIKKAD